MKRISVVGIIIALMLLPLLVWINVEGNPWEYLFNQVPSGQAFYIFSKLLGLYAFFLVWLHIIWVLLKKTALYSVMPSWKLHYHQIMGISLIAIIILHIAFFITAVSLRNGVFSLALLFPDFSDYYHGLLGLGVLALWLLPLIVYAGYRLKKNQKKQGLHHTTFLFYVLIFVHSIGAGSETKSGVLFWVYLLMGISVLLAILSKFNFFYKK